MPNDSNAAYDDAAAVQGGTGAVAKAEHCYHCFETIEAVLLHRAPAKPAFEEPAEELPLFVTWNTISSRAGGEPRLRGCIGTFTPVQLTQGLADFAKTSAFEDHRFSPISVKELSKLECGISLLTAFEDCDSYTDWDIGEHGIYIHVPLSSSTSPSANGTRWLSATYLPDVIPAQGWTKQEAVDSAIRKSGYSGTIDAALRKKLRVRRYRSEKVTRSYAEWQAWKTDANDAAASAQAQP